MVVSSAINVSVINIPSWWPEYTNHVSLIEIVDKISQTWVLYEETCNRPGSENHVESHTNNCCR